MAPKVSDTVEFQRELSFGAQTVYLGTRGIVTQVIGTDLVWVSVPSLGREVLVPADAVGAAANVGGVKGSALTAMSRFAVGDTVTLRYDRHYGNDLVLAGTEGKVTQIIGGSHAALYWVTFKGMDRDVLCPESDVA